MKNVKNLLCLIICAHIFCGFSDNNTEFKEYSIKVGASPVVSSAGLFIAYEKGYFAEQGLTVDLTYFKKSGAPMTALLSNGVLDVGGGNISAGLWNAINQGVNIKLVADKGHIEKNRSYISLLVRRDIVEQARYKQFSDLKGFKLGLTALGVSQQIAAERFLRKGGLSLNDVTFLTMPYSQMNVALQSNVLDATVQLEPYVAQAIQDQIAVKVADVYEVYPEQQSAAIFYSPKFIEQYPALAQKFMVAYLQGVRSYIDAFIHDKDKENVISLLKKHINIEDDAIWQTMTPIGLNPNGYLQMQSLREDAEWYNANGYLEIAADVESAVDHSFVDSALKAIGEYPNT